MRIEKKKVIKVYKAVYIRKKKNEKFIKINLTFLLSFFDFSLFINHCYYE